MITDKWLSTEEFTHLVNKTRQIKNTHWAFFGYKPFKKEELELLGKDGIHTKVIISYANLLVKKDFEIEKWRNDEFIGGDGEIYTYSKGINSSDYKKNYGISQLVGYKINLEHDVKTNLILKFGFEEAQLELCDGYKNPLIIRGVTWSNENMKSLIDFQSVPLEKLNLNKAFNVCLKNPLDLKDNKIGAYNRIEAIFKEL